MLKKIKEASTFLLVGLLILALSAASFANLITSAQADGPIYSENENKYLATMPDITWNALTATTESNKFSYKYETFVNDHFMMRDNWIFAKSVSEFLLLKTENNGVAYGKEHYLFPKFYSFDAGLLQRNLDAIDLFAFDSVSDVSVIVVPSASYPLVDYVPNGLPVVDESAYISEINNYLSNTTTPINVKDRLVVESGRYIYYRTDHHWTTYGAWLAYSQFASVNNLTAFDYFRNTPNRVEGFLGTSYSKAKNFNVVPDTIEYFDFDATMEIYGGTPENPTVTSYDSIYNYEQFQKRDKYAAFLHGNNAYYSITAEPGVRKLDNVLVICDSYGYSFIPFLTENYNHITVVDPRYYTGDFSEFRDTYYDDIIILYGFKTLTEVNLSRISA